MKHQFQSLPKETGTGRPPPFAQPLQDAPSLLCSDGVFGLWVGEVIAFFQQVFDVMLPTGETDL
jgi:hypothetical protein